MNSQNCVYISKRRSHYLPLFQMSRNGSDWALKVHSSFLHKSNVTGSFEPVETDLLMADIEKLATTGKISEVMRQWAQDRFDSCFPDEVPSSQNGVSVFHPTCWAENFSRLEVIEHAENIAIVFELILYVQEDICTALGCGDKIYLKGICHCHFKERRINMSIGRFIFIGIGIVRNNNIIKLDLIII